MDVECIQLSISETLVGLRISTTERLCKIVFLKMWEFSVWLLKVF